MEMLKNKGVLEIKNQVVMKTVEVNFWCNAGKTEEKVEIEIYEDEDLDAQINEEFEKWCDNNQQQGWEIIKN
jgi:hypothetical protein